MAGTITRRINARAALAGEEFPAELPGANPPWTRCSRSTAGGWQTSTSMFAICPRSPVASRPTCTRRVAGSPLAVVGGRHLDVYVSAAVAGACRYL